MLTYYKTLWLVDDDDAIDDGHDDDAGLRKTKKISSKLTE